MEFFNPAKVSYPLDGFNIHDLEGIPLANKIKTADKGKKKVSFDCLLTDVKHRRLQSYKKMKPTIEIDKGITVGRHITIYSDAGVYNHGYCLANNQDVTFGVASCIVMDEKSKVLYRTVKLVTDETNSNEMEVFACLLGLRWLFKNNPTLFSEDSKIPIVINTDSEFVFSSITDKSILDSNIKKCIRKSENNSTWNSTMKELLTELHYIVNTPSRGVYAAWIKSHSKGFDLAHDYNNLVDMLCNIAINKHLDQIDIEDTKRREIAAKFQDYIDIIDKEF